MGLFICSLLIVLIVKSQVELQVASYGSQRTVCCEQDTSSKIDEFRSITENYLNMVNIELINTNDQVKELKVTINDTQETFSSELAGTRREVDELQVTVSGNQETVLSELRDTSYQLRDTRSEMGVIERQVGELQESVSELIKLLNGGLLVQWPSKDCSDLHARGVTRSGVYTIKPLDSGELLRVYCDMETHGGGWTVFQRRQDGSVDFYLDFASYSRGFGNLGGEFWLGNDNLHRLTAQGDYELRVELSDFESESRYAAYDSFNIADVSDNYRLTVGSYSGTAGDSLRDNNNHQFTTKDRDNNASGVNCAQTRRGAWWYVYCGYSNLNGLFLNGTMTEGYQGVIWYHWKGGYYSLKTTEMKIRPTPQ